MVHGTPDWGLKKKSTVYALDDMAELAARLGSIVTFDRRGDVAFLDDFENGLIRWATFGTVATDTTRARSKGTSIKAATATIIRYEAEIFTRHHFPALSKIGLEFSWLSTSTNAYILAGIIVYDGARYTEYRARYDIPTSTLAVKDSTGAYQTLATDLPLKIADYLFFPLKLVIDLETKKYTRVLLGSHTSIASAYDGYDAGATTAKHIVLSAIVGSPTDTVQTAWFDDAILTQNEP